MKQGTDNNTEVKPDRTAKILTVIFIAIILLPVTYAALRVFVWKPANNTTEQPAKAVEQK